MPSQYDDVLRVKRDARGQPEELTEAFFNTRFRSLDDRFAPIEDRVFSEDSVLALIQERVLTRSEDVIADLRARLVSITNLEWLTASSGTSTTFTEGVPTSLVVAEADRALFAPGPVSIVSRTGDPYAYALVTTIAYGRETTGQWDVTPILVAGDLSASHTDWSIGALAGSTLAQMNLLGVGKAARDAAVIAQGFAQAAATAAGDKAAATASDRVQTGLDRTATGNDRATTMTARDQAVAAASTVDTSKYLQLDGLRQLTGKLLLAASAAGRAAFNIPAGTDPSAPAEGDVWYAGSGIIRAFVAGAVHRIPFLGLVQSWGARQTFLVPPNIAPGAVSAVPADGDLRTTATTLVVRASGTDVPLATAADVVANADALSRRIFYGNIRGLR